MQQLVVESLKYNLVPAVVPSFSSLTVLEAFTGAGTGTRAGSPFSFSSPSPSPNSSSCSFRHGLFDTCVPELEVVLSTGEVVLIWADSIEHGALFEGLKGSLGTLGVVVTLLCVRLIPAKGFAELRVLPVQGYGELVEGMRREVEGPVDLGGGGGAGKGRSRNNFVDGVMFGRDRGLLMLGRMVDGEEVRGVDQVNVNMKVMGRERWSVKRFTSFGTPPFCRFAEEQINDPMGKLEGKIAIPIQEYLFRYDCGEVWTDWWASSWKLIFSHLLGLALSFIHFLSDFYTHTRVTSYGHHSRLSKQQFLTRNFALPYDSVEHFVDFLEKEVRLTDARKTIDGVGVDEKDRRRREQAKDQSASSISPTPSNSNLSMNIPIYIHPLTLQSQSTYSPPLACPFYIPSALKSQYQSPNKLHLLNVSIRIKAPDPSARAFKALNRALGLKARELGGMEWLSGWGCSFLDYHYNYDDDGAEERGKMGKVEKERWKEKGIEEKNDHDGDDDDEAKQEEKKEKEKDEDEEEELNFWKTYDHIAYDALRKKYHAEDLPSVFQESRMKMGRDGGPKKSHFQKADICPSVGFFTSLMAVGVVGLAIWLFSWWGKEQDRIG